MRKRYRNYWLLVLLAQSALASVALAGVGVGPIGKTITIGKVDLYRKIRICAIPDTQNQMAGNGHLDIVGDVYGPNNTCSLIPGRGTSGVGNCGEPYCTKAKWCGYTWWDSGMSFVMNQAREITGNYGAIEWGPVVADDTTPHDHWANPKSGVPGCDVIISLGDINDVVDNSTVFTFGNSTADDLHAYANSVTAWKYIAASGIPAVLNRGNHDPSAYLQQLWIDSGISAKSYVQAIEPTRGISAAILVPTTNAGKPLCILTMNSLTAIATGTEITLDVDYNFQKNHFGCGVGAPTILVGHEVEQPISLTDCTTHFVARNLLSEAGAGPVMISMGGHYLNAIGCAEFIGAATDGNTAAYFALEFNLQEAVANGHYFTGGNTETYPFGNGQSSNGGAQELLIVIDPEFSTMVVKNWSPYSEASNDVATPGSADYLNRLFNFNFDARFP